MFITVLGFGSAFSIKNYQTNILLTTRDNRNLLIDAGSDIRFSLANKKLSFKDIDAIYITHLHADHIGGLEYIALNRYFSNCEQKIDLFGNSKILKDLWNHSLSGGLSTISNKKMELDDYFNVHYIDEDESFIYDDIDLTPIKTIHYKTEDDNIYSYGLFIRDMISGKKILFTGDTMFLPEIFQDYYDICDIIIHDCETISAYKTNVHSHYDDLCLLDKCIKRKMLLIHYNDNVDNDYIKRAKYDGFKGFITSDSFGRIV